MHANAAEFCRVFFWLLWVCRLAEFRELRALTEIYSTGERFAYQTKKGLISKKSLTMFRLTT
ncbi:MAG TPA: hypothetical protein DCS30_17370 [Rhizobiales bacterium]|nr:hypothetical protein [Hyphomicrobiales bacterium]